MTTINWQRYRNTLFLDAPTVYVDPRGDGLTGENGGIHRTPGPHGEKTWVIWTLEDATDHFRLAGLLNAIGQDITEIPEDAEPLEIPYEQLARGTVRDLYCWAENYGFRPSEVMELLQDHPALSDLLPDDNR